MDIFVTGATGALGRPVVRQLLAAGHRVRALVRPATDTATWHRPGVEPVRADLFDTVALAAAVVGCDAILHLATRIPPTRAARRTGAWAQNDRLRREGTRAVVAAALAAGVGTVIYPSVALSYPDGGDGWLDAATTPAEPPTILRTTLDGEEAIARFTAAGGRGIVLRLGTLYGLGATASREHLALARRGIAPVPGPAGAFVSPLWDEDAAGAIVAALDHAPAGIYDVVDDDPLPRNDLNAAYARTVGRHRLRAIPGPLVRLVAGAAAPLLTRSQRVSNRRFKATTGWAPRVPDARAGVPRLAVNPSRGADTPRRVSGRARAALIYLALLSLVNGFWITLAPRTFFDGFPGFGRVWVAVDGPYNEHLLRDFGATNLALALVVLVAFRRPTATLVRLAAFSSLTWQAPHSLYHIIRVATLPALADQLAQTGGLLIGVVAALALLREAARLDTRVVAAPPAAPENTHAAREMARRTI